MMTMLAIYVSFALVFACYCIGNCVENIKAEGRSWLLMLVLVPWCLLLGAVFPLFVVYEAVAEIRWLIRV